MNLFHVVRLSDNYQYNALGSAYFVATVWLGSYEMYFIPLYKLEYISNSN